MENKEKLAPELTAVAGTALQLANPNG